MEWKTRTKEWHDKASEENDDFVKFILEYLAFIGYITNCKYPNAGSDGKAIQKLKEDDNLKEKYLEKINNSDTLNDTFTRIIKKLNKSPLGNISRNIHDSKYKSPDSQINKVVAKVDPNHFRRLNNNDCDGKIKSLSDWNGMVDFWYTIRNNLFHGTKIPSEERSIYGKIWF